MNGEVVASLLNEKTTPTPILIPNLVMAEIYRLVRNMINSLKALLREAV